ncbi:MAG: nitrilase-related carbon-nitrogen hydrolase [Eubacteriales bacterium]|nr:nitrilase-related carbon-nitrogen hydrolase [Eubacteriales bacterium]
MAKLNWVEITKDDVVMAIENFLNDNPEYPEPRSTFLVYEGKKLPAKHIRGMAYQEHYGVEIAKSEFGGGSETVRFFERLGFDMEYHGATTIKKSEPKKVEKKQEPIEKKELVVEKMVEVTKPKIEVCEKEVLKEKIVIPSKKVIEQKNALQLILNRMFDGDIVCEKTYEWLKTPNDITGPYKKLYDALSAYRGDTTFAKKNVTLRCDFVCEGQKLIIEYDERQHFSEARRVSLESYRDIPVMFDRELWIKACKDIGAKDNAPANRDEVRAYYDSTRDIACYENGYKLIRIMHGQIDFENPDAAEQLRKYIEQETNKKSMEKDTIKVGMYLQTDEKKNKKSFDRILTIMKESDADIIVFPEFCYVPFVRDMTKLDLAYIDDVNKVQELCLDFSKELGKAVVVSSCDSYETIFSVYANAFASENETQTTMYIKHTMTGRSCLEFDFYDQFVADNFDPIVYKGFLIGLTICYDCNHALFSRMYGYYGIDLIINSTGGNVKYDKWFKYNKARAIENNCYTLVTMGGDGRIVNGPNYVYGFNKNGGIILPKNLNGKTEQLNEPGCLYLYEVSKEDGIGEADKSNPFETENKYSHLSIPIGGVDEVLAGSEQIADCIYLKKVDKYNVMFLCVDGMDIMKPEIVQKLLYAKELKKYGNRKYVIINKHEGEIDKQYFEEKLSVVLKVRAMENYCAVILESANYNKCYQTGKNKTAQVVKAIDGSFGIDLERTTGPEAIWRNQALRRKGYEWLVENATSIYEQ